MLYLKIEQIEPNWIGLHFACLFWVFIMHFSMLKSYKIFLRTVYYMCLQKDRKSTLKLEHGGCRTLAYLAYTVVIGVLGRTSQNLHKFAYLNNIYK